MNQKQKQFQNTFRNSYATVFLFKLHFSVRRTCTGVVGRLKFEASQTLLTFRLVVGSASWSDFDANVTAIRTVCNSIRYRTYDCVRQLMYRVAP